LNDLHPARVAYWHKLQCQAGDLDLEALKEVTQCGKTMTKKLLYSLLLDLLV
jgi:hypothetical protein